MRRIVALIAGLIFMVIGGAVVFGGNFAHNYVTDQLVAQKIAFGPKASLTPDLAQYAGQKVTTGPLAERYAALIGHHVDDATEGKSYSEVSGLARAAATAAKEDPSKADEAKRLGEVRRTALDGQLLRGTLLNAYGWWLVGSIALWVGWGLVILGALVVILGFVLKNRRNAPVTA